MPTTSSSLGPEGATIDDAWLREKGITRVLTVAAHSVLGVAGKGGLNMAILGEIPIGALRRANAFDPSSLYPIGLIQFIERVEAQLT